MSNLFKIALLAAGVAGAWFAATGGEEAPLSQREARQQVEREVAPAERGALQPNALNAAESEALEASAERTPSES